MRQRRQRLQHRRCDHLPVTEGGHDVAGCGPSTTAAGGNRMIAVRIDDRVTALTRASGSRLRGDG